MTPPIKPRRSIEFQLATMANDAIQQGHDPHDVTEMLGTMLRHLRANPDVAKQAEDALNDDRDPAAIASKIFEVARAPKHDDGDKPNVVQRAVAGVGDFVKHAIDDPVGTARNVVVAPVRAAFEAAVAPGVGEARHDPRLSKGGNSAAAVAQTRTDPFERQRADAPLELPAYDAEHGGITDKERTAAGIQTVATIAAPGVFRGARALTGSTAAGLATAGGAAGAAFNRDDPGAGALTGAMLALVTHGAGKGAAKVGGTALDAMNLRPSGRSAVEMARDEATMRAPAGPQANAATPSATPLLREAVKGDAAPAGSGAPQPSIRQQVAAATGRGAKALGIEDAKTRALRQIAERMKSDNVTRDDAIAFADAAGDKPVAVLDLGSGNVAGLARTAKDTPGLGRKLIPDFLHERSSGTFGDEGQTLQRIRGDVENRLGLAPENYYATLDDMTKAMKTRAASDYGAIRNTVVDDPEVLSLFDIPEWRAIHERIRANARVAGKEPIPPLSSGDETAGAATGAPTKVQNPQTLGTLDLMKRQLDKIITGKSESVGPVDRDMAYAMRTRLNGILDRMDELHPQYRAARAEYRGSAEAIDAYQAGKDEFFSLDPRALEAKISGMPDRLQDLYRRGAYDALGTKLEEMPDGANIGSWLEKNPKIRQRVAALAKTPDDALALRGDLNVERAMGDRKNFILGGPNTAERLIDYAHADAASQPAPTTAGDVARAVPVAGKLLGRAVDSRIGRNIRGQTSDVMGEVAKVMTRTGRPGVELTADEIDRLLADDAMQALVRAQRTARLSGTAAGTARRQER